MKQVIKIILTVIVWFFFWPSLAMTNGAEYVFHSRYQDGTIVLCTLIGIFFNLVYAAIAIVMPISILIYEVFQCL